MKLTLNNKEEIELTEREERIWRDGWNSGTNKAVAQFVLFMIAEGIILIALMFAFFPKPCNCF